MRYKRQQPPTSLFHGNEMMRLLTMVGMMGVLLLVIARSRDPNTWSWLAGDAESSFPSSTPASDENQDTSQKSTVHAPGRQSEEVRGEGGATKDYIPEDFSGTDLDPEESDAIKEEFQAVSDGTESILPEEMPAYNRLLRWVEKQTLSEMRGRAKKDYAFTRFYQSPDEYRGQLFEIQLTVHLIRDLDKKFDDKELYDFWGATDESGEWLYNGVFFDLPKGMPVGRKIYEQVTFVGYFFKLQGYLPAGGKPNSARLKAPLLVGRLIWHPTDTSKTQPTDWSWGLYLLAAFVIFLIVRWGLFFHGRSRQAPAQSALPIKPDAAVVDQWLSEADTSGMGEKENSDGDS
jgi:hypothetical protein